MELTPRSASRPSTVAGATCFATSAKEACTNSTCGQSVASSGGGLFSRSRARSSAAGSLSKPIKRPRAPRRFAISQLCPPKPRVASMCVPPRRTARNSIAGFKRTATWPNFLFSPCAPPGALFASENPFSIHSHSEIANGTRNWLALNSQTVELLFILRRKRLQHFFAQGFRVLHFQELHPPADRHFALQIRRLAEDRRQQQTALSIHLYRLAEIAGPLQQPLLGLVEIGDRIQLAFDLLPLLKGICFGTLAVPAGNVELRAVVLVDQALEFRRHLEAPFFVEPG